MLLILFTIIQQRGLAPLYILRPHVPHLVPAQVAKETGRQRCSGKAWPRSAGLQCQSQKKKTQLLSITVRASETKCISVPQQPDSGWVAYGAIYRRLRELPPLQVPINLVTLTHQRLYIGGSPQTLPRLW